MAPSGGATSTWRRFGKIEKNQWGCCFLSTLGEEEMKRQSTRPSQSLATFVKQHTCLSLVAVV